MADWELAAGTLEIAHDLDVAMHGPFDVRILLDGVAEDAIEAACRYEVHETELVAPAPIGATQLAVVTTVGFSINARLSLVAPAGGEDDTREAIIGLRPSNGEPPIVVRAVAPTALALRQPLAHAFGRGARLIRRRLVARLRPDWVRGHRRRVALGIPPPICTVVWSYTVGGRSRCTTGSLTFVDWRGEDLVTAEDVERRFPGWCSRLRHGYVASRGRELIDEAYALVRREVATPLTATRLRELVILRAEVVLWEQQTLEGSGQADELERAERNYQACATEPAPAATPAVIPEAIHRPSPRDDQRVWQEFMWWLDRKRASGPATGECFGELWRVWIPQLKRLDPMWQMSARAEILNYFTAVMWRGAIDNLKRELGAIDAI